MLKEYLNTAMEVAREAGVFLKHFSETRSLNVEAKVSDLDFVTDADKESQAMIFSRLREKYPNHRFVGEEDNIPDSEVARMIYEAGDDEYFWIADPLDGTLNYIHNITGYGVSIGLVNKGRSVAGAIYLPETDEMFYAAEGMGAFLNGKPIHCTDCAELKKAFLLTGIPVTNLVRRKRFMHWESVVGMHSANTRMLGSAAQNMAYAACGFAEAYWELGPHPWDVAAGLIIGKEAGCVLSDLWGNEFNFNCANGVVIAAPGIHEELTKALREADESFEA